MEISANVNNNRNQNTQLATRPPFGSMALSVRSNKANGCGGASASVNVGKQGQAGFSASLSHDTFQPNHDKLGLFLGSIPMFYMAGFALGFCPGLFLVASAAFLFSGRGQSFRHELSAALMGNNSAMQQLQVQFNKQNQQQTEVEVVKEAEATKEVVAEEKDEVIEDAEFVEIVEEEKEEEKVLTPLEMAQIKYAKAQENQEKLSLQVARREESEKVAQEKLELAQARLDRAQEQYDKANAEVKAQMTDRMVKLQENVGKKEANARVAHERTDLAKAQLDEATVKLAEAQRAFEDLQAEEMVIL